MKKIKQSNTVFTQNNTCKETQDCTMKSTEKVTLFDSENSKFITNEQIKRKEKALNIINKLMIILNIVSNIVFLFFIGEVLSGFAFSNGVSYNFTTFRIIGIIMFLIAQITGIYLFIMFFIKQNLKIKLIIASAPLAIILVGGSYLLFNIQNFTGEKELAIINTLGLSNFDASTLDFKYILIAIAIYLVALYFLYSLIFKKSKEIKKRDDKQPTKTI